jgi:hypothetical protein
VSVSLAVIKYKSVTIGIYNARLNPWNQELIPT